MYGYEIPVNEHAYAARERYLNDKKRADETLKSKKEYTTFIENARDYFLSEAINKILQESLDEETSDENRMYGKALVEGFVKENGSRKLLSEFARGSLLLAGIAEAVNDSHKKVIHGCAENSKCFKISRTINDDFFDKLIGLSDKKITEKINERVCNALEDYVQTNVNDKLDLEELAEKTKEKIENIKAKNEEDKEKMVKEFTMQYNKQAAAIKQRTNRKIGIFEQLMNSTTKGILSDQSILESFTTESGMLDVSKVKEKVTVMYTFLEMVNTTNMTKINETYLQNIFKNM